jgi:hypothetical protein
MRCLTESEARQILNSWLATDGSLRRGGPDTKRVRFYIGSEPFTKLNGVVFRLLECLGPWEEAWLWLEEPTTWNRPGLHLYTRLRQSYGELRLVTESPVHQFYGFEHIDLCSFVTVALMNEWSFALVTSHDYARLFVSRSSGGEIWFSGEERLQAIEANLTAIGIGLESIA